MLNRGPAPPPPMWRQTAACLALLFALESCHRHTVPALPPPDVNEFADLLPGQILSITVPFFDDGRFRVSGAAVAQSDGVLTIAASHLIGFQISRYKLLNASRVQRQHSGKLFHPQVRLQFASAQTTRNGVSFAEKTPPALPFPLPAKGRIRLIYFVRASEADHNMAIATSPDPESLDHFTRRLRANPQACPAIPVSCVWVPPGVAVRTDAPF